MPTELCVSITESVSQDAIERMRRLPPEVTLVELRLDHIAAPEVERILAARDRRAIVTCRPRRQGGLFEGEESDRLDLLRRAVKAGADLVDLEYDCCERINELQLSAETRLIVSYHDFELTPPDLYGLMRSLPQVPGAVLKIAAKALTIADAVRMLDFAQNAGRPIIALCMGEEGIITRILAPKVGAFLSYAAEAEGRQAAPGQVPFREMLDMYRFNSIGAGTRVYGVIAEPVSHSMSPAIHNAAFQSAGMDAVYLPLKVHDVQTFVPAFRRFDVGGYSVTIPHKSAMLKLVDEHDPLVQSIGALNTVVYRGARSFGYNTDVQAALKSVGGACVEAFGGDEEGNLKGRRVLLVGAGGAGRALAYGFVAAGASLTVSNRTVAKGRKLAEELGARFAALEELRDVDYEILVNSTSVGMHPNVDAMPVSEDIIKPGSVVFDSVYNPLETKLLRTAREVGCTVVGGFQWFVGQAAAQFELWTEQPAPTEVMASVVRTRLTQ